MAVTYTYDAEQLATSELFRVRRAIADTNVADGADSAYFADQEIQYAILEAGNERTATINLLRQLAIVYADKATVATGAQRINLSDISKRYEQLADRLEIASEDVTGIEFTTVTVVDGFSSTIDSDDVTGLGHVVDELGRAERSIEGLW